MKRMIIYLVVVNCMIFAYFQLADFSSGVVNEALPDLNPEKVKLLSDQELRALPMISEGADASKTATE